MSVKYPALVLGIAHFLLPLPTHCQALSQDEGSTTRMVYGYDASGKIVRRTAEATPGAHEYRLPPAERKLTVGKGGVTVSAISTDGKLTVTLPPGAGDTPSSPHLLRITSASATYTEKVVIR